MKNKRLRVIVTSLLVGPYFFAIEGAFAETRTIDLTDPQVVQAVEPMLPNLLNTGLETVEIEREFGVETNQGSEADASLTDEGLGDDSLGTSDSPESESTINPSEIEAAPTLESSSSDSDSLLTAEQTLGEQVESFEENETSEEEDDIASGVFGTAPWRITADGTLRISEGTFERGLLNGWRSYANVINKIVFEGPVIADEYCDWLFFNLHLVTHIEGLSNLDVSNVATMEQMFNNMKSLKTIDVSNFNVQNVMYMSGIFANCESLTHLDLSNWDTSNVRSMSSMFANASSLQQVDLSSFNTSSVGSMYRMFAETRSLTQLDLSHFDTARVSSFSYMFYGANYQAVENIGQWKLDTRGGMDIMYMFSDISGLTKLDLSSFVLSKRELYNVMTKGMFSGLSTLNTLVLGPGFAFYAEIDTGLIESGLPDVPQKNPYGGKWMNLGDEGSISEKGSYFLTTAELQQSYDGSTMADTYVWATDWMQVQDSEQYVGEEWSPNQSFVRAQDRTGAEIPLSDLEVDASQLDIHTAGEYAVRYAYEEITAIAKVTVNPHKTSIEEQEREQ